MLVHLSKTLLMVTNDAPTPFLNGRSDRREIAVTAVENESESLVGYTKKASSSCDAATGLFERSANECSFVAKYFSVKRKAWR